MFKKHILLLILSLLSIQIFVASGPDGSEPAKSIFSDVKYFESKCNIYKYLGADN